MRSIDLFWPAFASYLLVAEARANAPHERAIVPTASGQIGVNPVTAEPGSSYLNLQGPNSKYYQSEGSTTKWIGVNTEYLTDLVETTTINNVPTPITKSAPVAVVTATAAADGLNVGDVSVALPPKIVDVLNSIASDVASACAGKKRQACDARVEFANRVQAEIRPGGRLDFDFDFIDLPTINAPDVAAVLQAVTGTRSRILGTFIFLYIIAVENHGNSEGPPSIPPAANVPATMNSPTSTDGPTSTASGCDPAAPTGDDRPHCQADDCKGPTDGGKKERKCTEGKWKDCPCIREVGGIAQQRDEKWLDDQQKVLQFLIDNDNAETEPWCVHGASPHSGRLPAEYCQCGDNHESMFSIATSTTSPYDPCPYTTAPGPTITFTDPTPTPEPKPEGPKPNCNTVTSDSAWMHRGSALDAGNGFCSDNKGKDIGSSNPAPEHTYEDTWTYFDGTKATFLIRAVADPSCVNGDTPTKKIDENDCKLAVGKVVDECNTDSNDKKYGGSMIVNCQKYFVNPLRYIPCVTC